MRRIGLLCLIIAGMLLYDAIIPGKQFYWHEGSSNKQAVKSVQTPQETAEAYWVSQADWSYLCKNGEANFNNAYVTTPSGLTIQYRYEKEPAVARGGRTYYETSKIPVKPIKVIK